MKIALCFIISYEHILTKEDIWREWIEPNKDIINVYFYYKDIKKIKSKWIMEHTIPPNYIYETSYYHVIPAYISVLKFALIHDDQNKWFCMLTDSCCPVISPKRFRYLFYKNYENSLFSWKPAWWNPYFHQRGNLAKLPKELWLANDPWFILTKKNVKQIMHFINTQNVITDTICSGGLANESLFAIIFKFYKELDCDQLKYNKGVIKAVTTHIADWNRRSSSTSPHIFELANDIDIRFIENELEKNDHVCFIRKVATKFPDEIIRYYIYEHNKDKDNELVLIEPREIIFNKYFTIFKKGLYILMFLFALYFLGVFN
jgi:hypothetical protein